MAFGQPNFLLDAMKRQQMLRNPFAPKGPAPLTPVPQLPASFGMPATPQPHPQTVLPPTMPGAAAPPVSAPAPPAYDPTAVFRQALADANAFTPYQETQVPYQQPPVSTNPKGDAITAGIEMLGAALMPKYGAAIGKTVEAQGQQREQDYQRRTKEAQDQYAATTAEQTRLGRNSLAQQTLLERRVDAAQRGVEAEQANEVRAQAAADRKQAEEERNAIRRRHEQIYAQSVINRNAQAKGKLSEDHWYHAQSIGVRDKAIAERAWATKYNDEQAARRKGMDATLALRLADRREQIALSMEALKEKQQDHRDTRRFEYGRQIAALNNLDKNYQAVLRSGTGALAGPQAQAMAQQLLQPGGAWDQMNSTLKSMGVNPSESPEVQGIAEAGVAGGTTGLLEPSPVNNAGYGGQSPINISLNIPQTGGGGTGMQAGIVSPAGGGDMTSPNPRMSPMPQAWLSHMSAEEQRFQLPPGLLAAVASQESSGGVNMGPSSAGALGLMQFIPSTARQYGVNPMDPASSITGAGRYLHDLMRENGGDVARALQQYSGNTPGYAQQVMARLGAAPSVKSAGPTSQPEPITHDKQAHHKIEKWVTDYHQKQHLGEDFNTVWSGLVQQMLQDENPPAPDEMRYAAHVLKEQINAQGPLHTKQLESSEARREALIESYGTAPEEARREAHKWAASQPSPPAPAISPYEYLQTIKSRLKPGEQLSPEVLSTLTSAPYSVPRDIAQGMIQGAQPALPHAQTPGNYNYPLAPGNIGKTFGDMSSSMVHSAQVRNLTAALQSRGVQLPSDQIPSLNAAIIARMKQLVSGGTPQMQAQSRAEHDVIGKTVEFWKQQHPASSPMVKQTAAIQRPPAPRLTYDQFLQAWLAQEGVPMQAFNRMRPMVSASGW